MPKTKTTGKRRVKAARPCKGLVLVRFGTYGGPCTPVICAGTFTVGRNELSRRIISEQRQTFGFPEGVRVEQAAIVLTSKCKARKAKEARR